MISQNSPLNPHADEFFPLSFSYPHHHFYQKPSPPLLFLPHQLYQKPPHSPPPPPPHCLPPPPPPYVHGVFPYFSSPNYQDAPLQSQPRRVQIPCPVVLSAAAAAHGGGIPEKNTPFEKSSQRGQRAKTSLRKSTRWVPKNRKCVRSSSSSPPWATPPPPPPTPENGTAVMIKNIPNQYRRNMLLDFLDKLCQEQNHMAEELEESPQLRFEYDFVYLPMDFWRRNNYGYAFVNFTSAVAATKVRDLLQNYKWGVFKNSYGGISQSNKVCEITYARIQGKEELIKQFRNSTFVCHNSEYLPVVLSPPRDGANTTMANNIGRCLPFL